MKPTRTQMLHAAGLHLDVVRKAGEYTGAARHKLLHLNRKIALYQWDIAADLFTFNDKDGMERAVKQMSRMCEETIASIREWDAKSDAALAEAKRLQRLAARRTVRERIADWWPLVVIRAIRS